MLCPSGHTTVNSLAVGRRAKGTRAPEVLASWVAFDSPSDRCIRVIVTRTSECDQTKVARIPCKTVPSVRYGIEPLADRDIVLTSHARVEADADELTTADLRHVLRTGQHVQTQPGLIYRIEGPSLSGRPTAVCVRLNSRHEVVVITTFLLTGASRAE